MNLFLKGNSPSVVTIRKFLSQLYITIQFRRAISSWHFFQRLNFSRVVLCTNICKIEKSCYISKKVVRVNSNKEYVTLKVKISHEIHITPVVKSSLTKSSSVVKPTFIVVKYNKVIFYKFKIVKFIA